MENHSSRGQFVCGLSIFRGERPQNSWITRTLRVFLFLLVISFGQRASNDNNNAIKLKVEGGRRGAVHFERNVRSDAAKTTVPEMIPGLLKRPLR